MFKFLDNKNLGKVVNGMKTFSEIGMSNISDRKQLIIAGGRHKFSRLCGFLFDSAVNSENKQFGIVFICKLRSKLNHQLKKQVGGQWTIPSRWFALVRTENNQIDVLDKQLLFDNYQFDIDAFFESDLFDKETKKFQKTILSGLKQARDFATTLKDLNEKREALEEVAAIELSIPLIPENIFEDKNYKLINYMKENQSLTERSFDQYGWKDGSITGSGLIKMVQDANTSKQDTLSTPVRIYDRTANKYYNIVDSHLGKKSSGLMLEIDTRKAVAENEEKDKSKCKITESDGEWSIYARTLRSYDGYYFYADVHPNHFYTLKAAEEWKKTFLEEISNALEYWYGQTIDRHELYVNRASDIHNSHLISFSTAEFDPKYKKAWKEYQEELSNPKYGKGRGDDKGLKAYDAAMRENRRKIEQIYAIDKNKNESANIVDEADDREPISHALASVGINASTANTIDQDAVEMQLIEKDIDADVEEAMKEIYK